MCGTVSIKWSKLERIQHRVARYIYQDLKSMETGCVSGMLKDLKLPSLQERWKHLQLNFIYKGLVPAMPHIQFVQPKSQSKWQTKAKIFENCVTNNIIAGSATCNSRPFLVPNSHYKQYRNSFSVRTTEEWNNLEDSVVMATSVDIFKKRISLCAQKPSHSSHRCIKTELVTSSVQIKIKI